MLLTSAIMAAAVLASTFQKDAGATLMFYGQLVQTLAAVF